MKSWSQKDPAETYPVAFDFSAVLPAGETISSSSWTASTYSGNDLSPSSVLYGSPLTSGGTVKQVVTGGNSGVSYLVTATVLTSGGSTFLGRAILPVLTQAP